MTTDIDRHTIYSKYLIRNTIWEKHNTQESQEGSTFSAGDHKIARNRHDSITKINMKY